MQTNSWLTSAGHQAPWQPFAGYYISSFSPCKSSSEVGVVSLFHLTELKSLSQGFYFCVWLTSAQLQVMYSSHCVSPLEPHWLLYIINHSVPWEWRKVTRCGRNVVLDLQKLTFKYGLKLGKVLCMNGKSEKPWDRPSHSPWMIGRISVRACRTVPVVGFLQNFGSLGRPFLCEAIF